MFEQATRLKLRFAHKGNISCEDLWDLTVNDLDVIYKTLSKSKQSSGDEHSLLEKKSKDNEIVDLKLEIVKHVFTVKVEEKKTRENLAARALQKRKIQALIADKQDEELKGKSVEELNKLIDELD